MKTKKGRPLAAPVLAVGLAATFGGRAEAGEPWFLGAGPAPHALEAAHAAYLSGDFLEMVLRVRDVLASDAVDPAVEENALALLEKAYEVRGKQGLPCDWKLPPAVSDLKVSHTRKQRPGGVEHGIRVSGVTVRPSAVRQLQIVRHPGKVILDRRAGIGEWEEGPDGEGAYEFQLGQDGGPTPAKRGLYLIHLELDDATAVSGWVILDRLVSSESPAVDSPKGGETLATRRPSFRWKDFRSPEIRPFERRSLWMAVAALDAPDWEWKERWSAYVGDPAIEGTSLEGPGGVELEDGRYVFFISYKETRRFGPVKLRRDSVTVVPFHVRGQ